MRNIDLLKFHADVMVEQEKGKSQDKENSNSDDTDRPVR